MGSLFSKHKHSSRVTEQDKAVLQLKQQRDKLNQMTKRIYNQIEVERKLAKSLLNEGKKNQALLLLKKKKYLENQIEKTNGHLSNIERLIDDIEFAQIEVDVLNGLKSGNEALKNMQKVMSLDDAERIMSDTQDGVEYQRELDRIVSGGLTHQDDLQLEEELARLTDETKLSYPEVPDHPMDDRTPGLTYDDRPHPAKKQLPHKTAVLAS